jgi:hypothetical protein
MASTLCFLVRSYEACVNRCPVIRLTRPGKPLTTSERVKQLRRVASRPAENRTYIIASQHRLVAFYLVQLDVAATRTIPGKISAGDIPG